MQAMHSMVNLLVVVLGILHTAFAQQAGPLPATVQTGFLNLTALQSSLFSNANSASISSWTLIRFLGPSKWISIFGYNGLIPDWPLTTLLEGEAFRIDPALVWKPDIYFYNEAAEMKTLDYSMKLKKGGTVFWSRHYIMQLSADLDFHAFPFDDQKLVLQLVSYGFDNSTILLEIMPNGAVYPDPMSDPDSPLKADLWTVNSIDSFVESFNEIMGQTDYSRLSVTISVSRVATYYVIRYIIPLAFISIAASAGFWIDNIEIKIGAVFTLLLAVVSFMFLLSSDLPKVSYNTRMDNFVLACFFFTFLGLAEFAVVHAFSNPTATPVDEEMELIKDPQLPPHNTDIRPESSASTTTTAAAAAATTKEATSSSIVESNLSNSKTRWIPVLLDVSLRVIQPLAVCLATVVCFADLSTGALVGIILVFVAVSVSVVAIVYRMILVPGGVFSKLGPKIGHR
ncbi:neurotransmitter-gated ion-channel ligand binding domain-containing protein [Obelidium mucronatum]|nr:neurotransmitter-gated ion-channel ligand binding domain-containing protein [Obelidium mucronatum]